MQNPNSSLPIVSVVPSNGTGDGRPSMIVTPGDAPNVLVKPMSFLLILFVKAAKVYLDTFLAIPTVAFFGNITGADLAVPLPHDFATVMQVAAVGALVPAGFSVLRNVVSYLGAWEQKLPALSA